ncbi:MAG: protein kinase domain-containing protein [Phycisphaerales bacterium]
MSESERSPDHDAPLVNPTEAGPPPVEQDRIAKGAYLGPYRLLTVLGEGGFGRVWLAERREPIVQRVAIKIIKAGMDSKAVIARFEQERQALAVMDHPCIAKVHDAGTTPAGHPYFVMEHVSGEPITAFCDRHNFSIRQRLELLVPLCEAVQHAHHKGIIHRDIKPSNVLVSIQDEKPAVKIIDFGVAKAISHTLTDKTIFTEQGQIIGTPEYMSPEQAEMGAVDIDTRTDVYALGVLLYELLTGALPFDRKTLRSKGFGEIQRLIREADPPKPSTRLTSLGGEADAIARHRQTSPATLAGELRDELEWIPLKAIRKDRAERYRTPIDLADDIRNYLSGRALTAGPESAGYRLRKLIRRNRAPFIAGGVAAGALLVALVGVTFGFLRASAAERLAEAERDRALAATAALQEEKDKLAQALNDLRSEQQQKAAAQQETTQQLIERQAAYAKLLQSAAADLTSAGGGDPRAALNQCDPAMRGWEWYMLWGLLDDSQLSVSGSSRSSARVWLGADDRSVYRLSGRAGLVEEFDIPSGQRRRAWAVRVNDDPRLKEVRLLAVTSMSRDATRALIAGTREYDPPTGGSKRRRAGRELPPIEVFMTVEAATGRILAVIEPPTASRREAESVYWSANLSPDGSTIVLTSRSADRSRSSGKDGEPFPVLVRRAADGEVMARCTPFPSGATGAEFSPDGAFFLIRSAAIEAWEWAVFDSKDGRELRRATRGVGAPDPNYFLSPFTADGGIVLSGTDGVRVEDARTGAPRRSTLKGTGAMDEAVFSPRGGLVFASSREYSTEGRRAWRKDVLRDAATGRFARGVRAASLGSDGYWAVCEFTSDERLVLMAQSSGAFAVWPTSGHDVLTHAGEFPQAGPSASLSADESRVQVSGPGQSLVAVDLPAWFRSPTSRSADESTAPRAQSFVSLASVGASSIDAAFKNPPSEAPDAKPTAALLLPGQDRVLVADDRAGLSVWCQSTKQRLVRIPIPDASLAPQADRPAAIAWMQMSTRTDRLAFTDTSGRLWVLSPADQARAAARSAIAVARTKHLLADRVLTAIDDSTTITPSAKEIARQVITLEGESDERVAAFVSRCRAAVNPDRRDLELAARLHAEMDHPAWPGRKGLCAVSASLALSLGQGDRALDALGSKDEALELVDSERSMARAALFGLVMATGGDPDTGAIAAADTLPDLYAGPGDPIEIRPPESAALSRLVARVPSEVYGGVKPEEAWPAVKALFDRGLSVEAMIEEVKTLYPPGARLRATALGLAARGRRAADRLNAAAWEAATGRAPRNEASLKIAMAAARQAVALRPDEPGIINTLAAVEFRAGLYTESLATLQRGITLAESYGEEAGWSDFAIQAMNHAKLGNVAEARAALDRLTAVQPSLSAAELEAARPLIAEAEALVKELK